MWLMKWQAFASKYRGLPVDNMDTSQKINSITGETVQLKYLNSWVLTTDAWQAAGVMVVGKLAYGMILDEVGWGLWYKWNTSLSFTSTALTTEIEMDETAYEAFDWKTLTEILQWLTRWMSNGEYCVDSRRWLVYWLKVSTATTLTATAYSVNTDPATLEAGDIEIGAVEIKDAASDTRQSVSTLGSVWAGVVQIVDDAGNQITSFGSPSTIAEYKSPSDFTSTYTSTTTITLSSLPFTITDSSQIVYIRVIPASGDAEVYTNGSSGVTMTVSSNVLTIAGAGTPFTAGDVYEIGINSQTKAFDPSTNSQMNSVLNTEYSHYTDAEPLVTASDIGAADGTYIDQGAEIDMTGYTTLGIFVKFTVNDSTTNTIKVLSKHAGAGAEEFVLETEADYIKILGDASTNIYYKFGTNGIIPIVQIQSAAADVDTGGGTVGTLEIYIVKK